MSENSSVEASRQAGAYVKDVEMPESLKALYDELVGYEALLIVEMTGAKAPENPWENPELIESLKSLIDSGRVLSGVPEDIVADYKKVVGKGENSLGALAARIQLLAISTFNYFNSEGRLRQWTARKSLLDKQSGFFNERAARRLSSQIPSMAPAIEGVYDRRTCVDTLDLGLSRLRDASDLYRRVVENNAKMKAESVEKGAEEGTSLVSSLAKNPELQNTDEKNEELKFEELGDLLEGGGDVDEETVEVVEEVSPEPKSVNKQGSKTSATGQVKQTRAR